MSGSTSTRRRFRSLHPRTLRSRIVAAVLLVLVVGFAVVGVVTTVVVHRVLLDRLDAQLRAAGTRFAVALEKGDHDKDNGSGQFGTVQGQAIGTLGARILDGKVTASAVIGRQDQTAALSTSALAVLGALRQNSSPQSIDIPDLGAYRVIVSAGRDGDLQVTGLPTATVEETTDELVLIEAIVFAVVLVGVGIVSALFIRRTLRPLDRVAATASRVAALPLASGAVSLPDRAPVGPPGSEIETVAVAFNTMLEQVESALTQRHESEEQLRRFLADASHELRTPVAVVRSHAEYAQQISADLPAEVAHALERIRVQSERMGHLVDELLMLARLDAGRPLNDEDVDLTLVVLEATSDARIASPDRHWQLGLPEDEVTVRGDAVALQQVVANLLANARVHTPPGTTVRTQLSTSPQSVRLSVRDDGPGIPPEVGDRVFERFVRGDAQRSDTSGSTGLGLPIVAAIVAAHGGTVRLDPDQPRGTGVVVNLPLHTGS